MLALIRAIHQYVAQLLALGTEILFAWQHKRTVA